MTKIKPVVGVTPEAQAWIDGPLRRPSGSSGERAGVRVRSSLMGSSKGQPHGGLDLVAGAMTITIIIVLAMAFGFLIIVTKAFVHWLRR